MSTLMQQVLDHKCQRRREPAVLPFPEKVKIVEQMRETVTRIRASAARARLATKVSPGP